jgi:hypothetical protein
MYIIYKVYFVGKKEETVVLFTKAGWLNFTESMGA